MDQEPAAIAPTRDPSTERAVPNVRHARCTTTLPADWDPALVGALYDAAAGLAPWPEAVRSLAEAPDGEARRRLAWLFPNNPHIERALAIRAHLDGCRSKVRALSAVVERLATAVLVLRGDGNLDFATDAARALLAEADGLMLGRGSLRALARADDAKLQRALRSAGRTNATGACTVSRPSGRRPFQILVAPCAGGKSQVADQARGTILFVVDPASAADVPAERVALLLGLTGAEARLAVALASGSSLSDYAEQAGISIGTARWTLKQALTKTDTDRQSALVALVLKLAIVRPDG